MGKRASATTGIELLAAFLEQSEWRQRDLADKLELTERAIRTALLSMQNPQFPIRELPPPPTQRWMLPDGWLPHGVALHKSDALATARYLARQPSSPERNRLLGKLVGTTLPWARTDEATSPSQTLRTLEDALSKHVPLRIVYRAASGDHALVAKERVVSVAAVLHGPHDRFIGVEHGASRPKRYRVDRVEHAVPDPSARYRSVEPQELRELVRTSIGGFHGGGDADHHTFTVRAPEASWVRENLPVPKANAILEDVDGGVRVTLRTAAPDLLARFVVGLGDAARVETHALRHRVTSLAEGALRQSEPPSVPGPSLTKTRGGNEGRRTRAAGDA